MNLDSIHSVALPHSLPPLLLRLEEEQRLAGRRGERGSVAGVWKGFPLPESGHVFVSPPPSFSDEGANGTKLTREQISEKRI